MGRRQPELGIRRPSLVRRTGQGGFPGFGGMLLDPDAGALPPNRLRFVENARFANGNVRTRPSLTPFSPNLGVNCFNGLYDFQPVRPHKLVIFTSGCSFGGAVIGKSVLFFDMDQSQRVSYVNYYGSAGTSAIPAVFDGEVYIGFDSTFKKLAPLTAPYGIEPLTLGGKLLDVPITTFPGFTVRAMQAFDGKLFISLDNGGASKVVTWDGLSIRDDDTAPGAPVLVFQTFRNMLVAGFAAASNKLRWRATGGSPGSWTDQAPAAGTIASVQMRSFKDNLYITSNDVNIWKWIGPGAGMTVDHALPANARSQGIDLFDRDANLYFSWDKSTDLGVRIGKYDGAAYTDTLKDLLAQFAGDGKFAGNLRSFYGSLYTAGASNGAPSAFPAGTGFIFGSPDSSLTGAWVRYGDSFNTMKAVEGLTVI